MSSFLNRSSEQRQQDNACLSCMEPLDDSLPLLAAKSLARSPARAHRADTNVLCQCVLDQAAILFGIPARELRKPGRSRLEVARVRQIAMYVSHIVLGITMRDVGRGFDRDRTTVLHACQVVEDLRENREFDAAVAMMEQLASILSRFRDVQGR